MATKLYLHRTEITSPGTLPSGEQSSLTADYNLFDNEDGTENRLMDKTISTSSQTTLTNTSTGDTSSHNYYIARWVSPLLAQTSVAANTWTVEYAATESNAAANFPRSGAGAMRVCCYVWKPSNGTKYGNIIDGNSNADGEEAGTSQTVINFTFSGAAVSSLTAGDAVIVFELWAVVAQANGTARTQTIAYDGTTEGSTSNMAARLETPENLAFAYTRAPATETVSVSESLARSFGATRPINTETVASTESIARSFGAVRFVGGPYTSILFDGSNDRLNCGNHSDLWSQSLTKFSYSIRFYNTQGFDGSNFRDILSHGGASAQAFRAYFNASNGKLRTVIRDSGAVEQAAESNTEPSLNEWHTVVFVYDKDLGSNQGVQYLDKSLQTVKATLTESINISSDLRLAEAGNDFKGNIKDFRFWKNTALTQSEADKVADNDPTAPTPDYWLKMREGTGNPVDSIAGKTTTLENGASWEANKSPNTILNYEETNSTDSASRMLSSTRNPQETTSVGENLTRQLSATRLLSTETVTVGGGTIQTVHGFVRTMATEVVTIGENLTRKLDAIRTLPETIIIGDTLTRMLAATRAIATESIVIGENLVRLLAAQRILSDTKSVLDNLGRQLSATRTNIENTSVFDSLARKLEAFRTIGQTVSISDLLETLFQSGGGGNQNYTRTITEDTSISEQLSRMLEAFRTSSDTTVVDESINRTYSASRTISEDVSIIDSLTRKLDAFRTIVQTTSISDLLEYVYSPVGATNYVINLVENVLVSDSLKTLLSPIKLFKSSIGNFASEGIRTVRKGRILSPNRWRNSFYTYIHSRDPEHSEKSG